MDDITTLRRAVDDATRIVDGIGSDQRDLPTPCPDFTVGQLVDHLVDGAASFATALGVDPGADRSFKAIGQSLVAAFEQPGVLDGAVTLPWGEYPGAVVLQQAAGEVAIHAADLAHATGQPLGDDAVYERVFELVGDDWRVENVLGPALPCADDAPLLQRVLAFAGRAI